MQATRCMYARSGMIFLLVYNLIRLIMLRAAKRLRREHQPPVLRRRAGVAALQRVERCGGIEDQPAAARTPGATRAQTWRKTVVPAYDSLTGADLRSLAPARQILGYRLTSWHCPTSSLDLPLESSSRGSPVNSSVTLFRDRSLSSRIGLSAHVTILSPRFLRAAPP